MHARAHACAGKWKLVAGVERGGGLQQESGEQCTPALMPAQEVEVSSASKHVSSTCTLSSIDFRKENHALSKIRQASVKFIKLSNGIPFIDLVLIAPPVRVDTRR